MSPAPRRTQPVTATERRERHLSWLSLVDVAGPFLSVPVLVEAWPDLVSMDGRANALRQAHGEWLRGKTGEPTDRAWLDFLLADLLDWRTDLHWDTENLPELPVPAHDTVLRPDFVLTEPGEAPAPKQLRLLGLYTPGTHPARRIKGEAWAASPIERVAQLCRFHDVPLGLATDGRYIALVYAPPRQVSASAVFDTVTWNEKGDETVVRAFISLLERRRFFQTPDKDLLPALFEKSKTDGEDITEALGKNVRRAVEYLVESIGRADRLALASGKPGVSDVDSHEIYRGAVAVMMRLVFLLFAEEKGLLPAGNDLYDRAYSAKGLYKVLEEEAKGGEERLESHFGGWLRLLALFVAVGKGVEHPELRMPAYGGSIFDPAEYPWMQDDAKPLPVDDRTVLHMLRSVMFVEIGTGKVKEPRQLSFKTLDVEQIGYVYEGLLSFVGKRAEETTVGLIGKEGQEEEVPLSALEELRQQHPAPTDLARALAEKYKDSKPGSAKALEAKLTGVDEGVARRAFLAATERDVELTERLIPWHKLVRTDLRGLPMVFTPGALFVTESALRKNTGTHYTPRKLAEEVVEGALQPLLYSVGPLQTADESTWVPVGSAEILRLKVADIAMGSAAFLVAACRYLAKALVEAWKREDSLEIIRPDRDEWAMTDEDSDPTVVKAKRLIIEHCLYGVDINPMAVELAKLSLWLLSMDPQRPFAFLDHRLIAGDSLLGVTHVDQIQYMHLDPTERWKLDTAAALDAAGFGKGTRALIETVALMRRELTQMPGDTTRQVVAKATKLAEVRSAAEQTRAHADLVVGAGLAGVRRRGAGSNDLYSTAAEIAAKVSGEEITQARKWLATDQPSGTFDRKPVHWPLEFPEVFEDGNERNPGFDAVIGNPPFLGGKKLADSMGNIYREHLVSRLGRGQQGSADLVAYFLIQAHRLLNNRDQVALIAPNTLTQGATRKVGLDQILANGVAIRAAKKGSPWPSKGAIIEYCVVWTSRAEIAPGLPSTLDGVAVEGITASLDAWSGIEWRPKRLTANSAKRSQGSLALDLGLAISSEQARTIVQENPEYAEVIHPDFRGSEWYSPSEEIANRWLINFHTWPKERTMSYSLAWAIMDYVVPKHRIQTIEPGSVRDLRPQLDRQHTTKQRSRSGPIARISRTIGIARMSKVAMPMLVPTGLVFTHKRDIFTTEDHVLLAILSSAFHYWWAIKYASTMRDSLRYSPTDIYDTLPRPEITEELGRLGERLDSERRDYMLAEQKGLTATYNLVHDPNCSDADILNLREIHQLIDFEVCRAYGWDDLVDSLNHGHHETRQGIRYTVDSVAQRQILDRLLLLNKKRYEEEVAQGLHAPKKAAKASRKVDAPSLFDGL